MQNSSPTPFYPSTPGPSTRCYPALSIQTYQPIHSSPLAESPRSSPVVSAQRRRSSYKATFPTIPAFKLAPGNATNTVEEPQKAFLRERFKARCFERARQDREKALRRISRGRSVDGNISGGSSDGDGDADMDSEGEEDDENTLMQGEVRVLTIFLALSFISYTLALSKDHGKLVAKDPAFLPSLIRTRSRQLVRSRQGGSYNMGRRASRCGPESSKHHVFAFLHTPSPCRL